MTYLLFVTGLVILIAGGEGLVRGASGIARHFKLSPMLIGLTIVGFGTSAPELLVSLQAALDGQPGLALGNAIGSNIANVLLILGVAAVIAPLVIPGRRMLRDLGFMLGAALVFWGMLLDGVVSRFDGVILLVGLALFLGLAFRNGGAEHEDDSPMPTQPVAWAMTLGGLVGMVIGARLLVGSASAIARDFGVSEAVIGLTIVAIGTSLPELTTSVIAALRKHTDIAVGNVVGSNVFNILGILGVTSVITPIDAAPRFAQTDMVWVTVTSLGLVVVALTLGRLPRSAGVALLAAYGGYLVFAS
jgi:cation:H+ antiporter